MKTLLLHIPDDIYRELKDNFGIRNVLGNLHGPLDEFNRLIFSAVERGATDLTFERKKPEKSTSKKRPKKRRA